MLGEIFEYKRRTKTKKDMSSKFIILYQKHKELIECDEMVTDLIFNENKTRVKFHSIKLYKDKKLVLDAKKISVDNYEKLLELIKAPKIKEEIICLDLTEDDTFIKIEPDIINTKYLGMPFDKFISLINL